MMSVAHNLSVLSVNEVNNENNEDRNTKSAAFEEAVKATGYGKFNILLMLILIPCSFVQEIEEVAMPFVVPIAQCDLHLSLENKGVLNSIGPAGMILSGFVWGYLCDSYGRRKSAIYGYLLNSLCYVLAAFTQSFAILLIARFFSGVMFTGSFSAVTSYIAEFHSTSHRAIVQLIRGMTSSIAKVSIPLIGWAILPTNIFLPIIDNIVFRSWNIFLLVTCLPALMSAIIFVYMPESPKFLMTQGKNKDALKVFQLVHKMNSGKANGYPIKHLIEEKLKNNNTSSTKQRIASSFQALKPLFLRPYIFLLVHVCTNIFALVMGVYGLKLWYPQILQSMIDYETEYEIGDNIGMCSIIESLSNTTKTSDKECTVNKENGNVYINHIVLGVVQFVTYTLAGFIIKILGKKTLVVTIAIVACTGPMLLYSIPNINVMLAIFTLTFALSELGRNVLLSISLELFPTSFRISAINFHLTFVRLGVATGGMFFPYLLKLGCLPLSLFMTLSIFVSVILTSMLPSTENKALD